MTLGCKVNQYESQWMLQILRQQGHSVTEALDLECDCIIINTCAVTNEAERKSLQMIRRMKRRYPESKIVAAGCLAQLNPHLFWSECNRIVGNQYKDRFLEIIEDDSISTQAFIPFDYNQTRSLHHRLCPNEVHHRVGVMIEEGCNQACSYCIIPLARGRTPNSKPVERVVQEIKGLVDQGVKEVVLTGINLQLYKDNSFQGNETDLVSLIDQILCIPGDFRLRVSSLNPEGESHKWVPIFRHTKMCPHLHLSIQSGSNQVLRKMNRKYTIDKVYEWVDRLRSVNQKFSFSTDLIVGFPGETETDFLETVRLVQSIGFVKAHIFRFSPRKGTQAAAMTGQVDERKKRDRSWFLNAQAIESSVRYRKLHLNEIRPVLFERKQAGWMTGHDEYYLEHWIAIQEGLPVDNQTNQFIMNCRIRSFDELYMGRVVSEYVGISESEVAG